MRWMILFLLVLGVGSCKRQKSGSASPNPSRHVSVPGGGIISRDFFAMNTGYNIMVALPKDSGKTGNQMAEQALDRAVDAVREVEALMSSHARTGDVFRLNESDGEWVVLDPRTMDVLRGGVLVSEHSRGAFDITWAALRHLYRLKDPAWTLPPEESVTQTLDRVGYTLLELDAEKPRVRKKKPGVTVDLGGIAKGYALDLAANELRESGLNDFIINGGGDLKVSGRRPDRKWKLGIRDPRKTGLMRQGSLKTDGTVLTSGDYERFRMIDGVRHSHIIDPRTGRPSRGIISVTVIGPYAMISDALATALFITGIQDGMGILTGFPGYEAMWVDDKEKVHFSKGFEMLWEPGF